METFNNSFPYLMYDREYIDNDIDLEKSNLSAFNFNFCKFFENEPNTNQNMLFSPSQKKSSLDISDSVEQLFCENSNILNIDEEINGEDTCKIVII